jgi:tRNA threonylcarbamoyladenosine biosynthesis protein TsaE
VRQITHSVAETEDLAGRLAPTLGPGSCMALHGELGAGKTQFVRGLVKGLGGSGRSVSSPTFVLLNIYPTPGLTVYHLDAYRVGGPEDFEAIGFAELLEQGGLVVVEWPERVASLIPADAVHVWIAIHSRHKRGIQVERA